MGPRQAAVLFTINMAAIARFYERVVEMRVHKADHDHVVLEKNGFRLIVHQIPEKYAKNIAIAVPPKVRESGSIKLSFSVDSISRARDVAAQLGGRLYGPDREWEYDSTIVCDGWDSDGNVFQLFQPADR
jgi:predicted enzyme related to lactoylglutathione lyase